VEQFCDVCVLMKQRRLPFPQQSSFRAKEDDATSCCSSMTSPATCGLWSLAARERLRTPLGTRRPLQRRSAAAEFTSYCADEGIQRHYSVPYNPQQNDIVERHNQTVVGMARALLKQRGMSVVF
jgi:transposase InsO family protein